MFRLILSFLLLGVLPTTAAVLVPLDRTWSFLKGYSEASSPDAAAWRALDFDASSWGTGQAPFYYENSPDSGTAYTGNTVLNDMNGNYSCIFMRKTFEVANPYDISALQAVGFCDDGFIAWVNGHEVARFNMPDTEITYSGSSSPALPEPVPWYTNTVTNVQSFLVPGTNVFTVQAFNSSKTGSSDFVISPALFSIPNTSGPTLVLQYPADGEVVRQLTSVEVAFDKEVAGVDASDLLVNGKPAANLTIVTPSQFVFGFAEPATGVVQLAWASEHGIHDLSSASNLFQAVNWSCKLSPSAQLNEVIISEFMASNSGKQTNSLHDSLENNPDWIELYNGRDKAVSLTGWSLTDDPGKLTKWRFPSTLLSAKSYLVVFATGRDTNVAGRLHTSFKLNSSPAFLALVDSATNIVSAYSPNYPQQHTDVSYGRDRQDPSLTGFFTNATPGAANSTQGAGFGPEVQVSRTGGTFQTDFTLALSATDTNYDIRYVLVTANVSYGSAALTNIPTEQSLLYSGPITITNSIQVRARCFPRQPGNFPGPPRTESYVRITSAAAAFTSDMPIILLHNLAGGTVPETVRQNVILMTFEPVNGRSSMTNPPTLVTRAGFNIRGSSSAGMPQSSYAMEIWDEYNADNKVPFLGLPEESDWVLFGQNNFDSSYLHNPLIHQLSRDVGRYSPRTRFAEVFLNTGGGPISYFSPAGANYYGLYTIEEKIKRGKNRVDVKDLDPQATTAPEITGGYVLKIDRSDPNEMTFYDNYAQNSIVFVDPPGWEMGDPARSAQYNYITTYFSQFGAALWGANYTNPVSGYAAYIDVDSWLDHHILNVLSYNVDAIRLSGYFFKDRDKKIEMGPLWDFDRSMGSSDGRCFNPRLWHVQQAGDQGTDFFGNPNLLGVRWWQRLFVDPNFWQKWIDRWTDLRRDTFSTNHLFATIDTLGSQLKLAQPREAARWSYTSPRSGFASINGYGYNFSGTYQGELSFLKRWLADRVDFIDTNFLRAPVFSAQGGAITKGFPLTITAPTIEPNTTIYYTLNGTDPRLPGGAVSPTALSGSSPLTLTLTNNARVFARNFNLAHKNMTGGTVGGNPPISSPWSGTTIGTFVVATPQLVITEIMYDPPDFGTNQGTEFEFIELKNVGTQMLNLIGIRFTNGIQFTFSATNAITNLAPGEYLVLAANPALLRLRYPGLTNIVGPYAGRLDNSGDRICLVGALQEPILNFKYNNSWYPVTSGRGFSLVIRNDQAALDTWTNSTSWRVSSQIGGSPGRADPAPAGIATVFINELLTHTDLPERDTVELFNPTDGPADISGWFLTDDHSRPMKFQIPSRTVIPAGQYITFDETDFNSGASNSFSLSSLGEEIHLYSGDGTNLTGYSHGFDFGPQKNGATFGRHVTSDGREHFVTEKRNTLGSANAGPRVGPVVINEINYAPPPFGLNADTLDEYIELRNITGQPAPLFDPLHPENPWRVEGGLQFTFPPRVTMPPWSYLLLVKFDPAQDPVMLSWFRARYGISMNTPIYGPCLGNLANEGERVSLFMPDPPETASSPIAGFVPYVLAEEVRYSNLPPWPTGADGTGQSLQRIASAAFGDEPANWQAGAPTPGQLNPGAMEADTDHDGLPDEWELANGFDPSSADTDNGPLGDPDGDGANNLSEFIAGTNPQDGDDYLHFAQVTTSNQTFQLQFEVRTNHTYQLEHLNDLGSTNWIIITNIVPNVDGPCIVTNSLTPTGQFYRLKVTRNPF